MSLCCSRNSILNTHLDIQFKILPKRHTNKVETIIWLSREMFYIGQLNDDCMSECNVTCVSIHRMCLSPRWNNRLCDWLSECVAYVFLGLLLHLNVVKHNKFALEKAPLN